MDNIQPLHHEGKFYWTATSDNITLDSSVKSTRLESRDPEFGPIPASIFFLWTHTYIVLIMYQGLF